MDYEVPVWALIQHTIAVGDIDDPTGASDDLISIVAEDFAIPVEAVRAALAYYAENRAAIDTKIASNAAGTAA